MKTCTDQKKRVSGQLKDRLGLEVYEVSQSSISMSNDPVVKQRTAEARAFLQKTGIPDIEQFRTK